MCPLECQRIQKLGSSQTAARTRLCGAPICVLVRTPGDRSSSLSSASTSMPEGTYFTRAERPQRAVDQAPEVHSAPAPGRTCGPPPPLPLPRADALQSRILVLEGPPYFLRTACKLTRDSAAHSALGLRKRRWWRSPDPYVEVVREGEIIQSNPARVGSFSWLLHWP